MYLYDSSLSPLIIDFQGNIGSGKTTLIEFLKNDEQLKEFVIAVPEPIEFWKDLLEGYYKDKESVGASLQCAIMCARTYNQQRVLREYSLSHHSTLKILFFERDLSSCDLFNQCINMSFVESCVVSRVRLINSFLSEESFPFRKSYSVYLKTTAEKCLSRIQRRSRIGENLIPLDYLKRLDKAHEDHFEKIPENQKLVIENNTEDDSDSAKQQLKEFLLSLRERHLSL